jgi:hypothetical protein
MNILAISAVLLGALASSACTTLGPKLATPKEVPCQLLPGELLQHGDRVTLVTSDEIVYELPATEIDFEQGFVIGPEEQVPIADIVAVETRELSMGKTALLAGGLGVRGHRHRPDCGCPGADFFQGRLGLLLCSTVFPHAHFSVIEENNNA